MERVAARRTKAAVPLRLTGSMQAAVPLPSDRDAALAELIALSETMASGGAEEGRALIERVLPSPPEEFTQWSHYPKGDAIDPGTGARWFYHAHPPDQRGPKEHGHFHMFLPLSAFGELEPLATPAKDDAAKVVHVAALCFDIDGLPTHWIATNQWVTEEYLYPADAVIARLNGMDMSYAGDAKGIAHVGRWLTCALRASRSDVTDLLLRRDEALAKTTARDREAEILASLPFRV